MGANVPFRFLVLRRMSDESRLVYMHDLCEAYLMPGE